MAWQTHEWVLHHKIPPKSYIFVVLSCSEFPAAATDGGGVVSGCGVVNGCGGVVSGCGVVSGGCGVVSVGVDCVYVLERREGQTARQTEANRHKQRHKQ